MSEVLILHYEMTADVKSLSQALNDIAIKLHLAVPEQIDFRMDGVGISFYLDGKTLKLNLVFGWSSSHKRERGEWLLSAFEIAGVQILNAPQALSLGQNKFRGA